ncbi:Isotrichodermin C-15 hydroxylase [Colletotrichum tanaceti]|uniref:Isotrichodermin C-15 hydroxylase n=1 Tax=Colletotrichum tanaceti TaxID=1306861 RepID=A0A4U6XA13_9PEZI|nr:Isotrichodermin C-15 hydroxylase [Colletotrichum tanaceti]TKW51929.1 Isotrichodermin C-15 hydroxylase [Colletotrichum tanaceti]
MRTDARQSVGCLPTMGPPRSRKRHCDLTRENSLRHVLPRVPDQSSDKEEPWYNVPSLSFCPNQRLVASIKLKQAQIGRRTTRTASNMWTLETPNPTMSLRDYLVLAAVGIAAYSLLRTIYLVWFHPLAKFPGPKIAAVSNVWYGYQWLSGRYPWAMQTAFERYGDVVRIAPNELVFITPKAYADIYTSTINGRPAFVKSDLLDTGDKYEGLASERDIDKHRAARKQLAPAFSPRSLKQYEPAIHAHVDGFVAELRNSPAVGDGVDIAPWFERATCDLGGSITLGHNFKNIQSGQNHPILESLLRIGHWATFRNVMRRFPLLYPLSYVLLPPKVALSYFRAHSTSKALIRTRVRERHDRKELDYMTQFLKNEAAIPPDDFLVAQAGHLILDHYESSSVLTAGLCFLTKNDEVMAKLQTELRTAFKSYDDISDDKLQGLPWLAATIEEVIRLHTNVPYGLPRISPGYTVDGHHVAKNVVVSSCAYATTHSEAYFSKPYEFKPQRWLPKDHPDYDGVFDNDDKAAFRPFSAGSRNCLGQAMAYVVLRIMFAKLVWSFKWDLLNKDEMDWDRDLRLYIVWQKPKVHVRVTPFENKV